MKILVTGGAGFIGSNFLNEYVPKFKNYQFLNLDDLTYAGNLSNINIGKESNYKFYKGDIGDYNFVEEFLFEQKPDLVVNFAAESHVDNSIEDSSEFIRTNIVGTYNMISVLKNVWKNEYKTKRFHHVSTDEVFGTLGNAGAFNEGSAYNPRNPYSASKAASDQIVRAFFNTFKFPATISNCSNNYGPNQHDEKLIPSIIRNSMSNNSIKIYGNGKNIRDWIFVKDHCKAIWDILFYGKIGESYNVGALNELTNNEVLKKVLEVLSKKTKVPIEVYLDSVKYVKDRKGHDFRYCIDASKIKKELNWRPSISFEEGLENTIDFYYKKYSEGR